MELESSNATVLDLKQSCPESSPGAQEHQGFVAAMHSISDADAELLHKLNEACTSDKLERDAAHQFLLNFRVRAISSLSLISPLLHILPERREPHLIVFTCATLREIFISQWTNITPRDTIEIRDFSLTVLYEYVILKLPDFVISSVVRLISSIVRLGWIADNGHRNIITCVSPLLKTPVHGHVALQLLRAVVSDIQPDLGTFCREQRTRSMSFRNNYLEQFLRLSLQAAQQSVTDVQRFSNVAPSMLNRIREESLRLCLECLRFDFPGTGYPPLSEHQPLLVPTSWRFIKDRNQVVGVLLDIFNVDSDDGSAVKALVLECLTWLVTLKRSMFSSIDERRAYLGFFVDGILGFLAGSQPGRVDAFLREENHHSLCRLLEHTRSSFPFTDFIVQPNFDAWMECVHTFTVDAFSRFDSSAFLSGQNYLLNMWGALAANSMKPSASLYILPSSSDVGERMLRLSHFTHSVATSFVDSRLHLAEVLAKGEALIDDPIAEGCPSEFPTLSQLIRLQSVEFASFVLSRFEAVAQRLQALTASAPMADFWVQWNTCEGQLAVLVYVVCAIIRNRSSWTTLSRQPSQTVKAMNAVEGRLCARVFELMQFLEQRRDTGHPLHRLCAWVDAERDNGVNVRVELALLEYLEEIHKMVTSDGAESSLTTCLLRHLLRNLGFLQGEMEERDDDVDDDDEDDEDALSGDDRVDDGKNPALALLDLIVSRVVRNLSSWVHSERIIGLSLNLFNALAYGVKIIFFSARSRLPKVYSNGRILLRSEFVLRLLHSAETAEQDKFPFLRMPVFARFRTRFYHTVARLFFMQDDSTLAEHFTAFMSSLSRTSDELSGKVLLDVSDTASAIGLMRDLRGIFQACSRKQSFTTAFDWFHPRRENLMVKIARRFSHDSAVMTPLLKLAAEIVDNQTKRMQFHKNSTVPIVLFQSFATIVCVYADALLQKSDDDEDDEDESQEEAMPNDYTIRYKGICACMNVVRRVLDGGFLNLGVLQLYNDQALNAIPRTLDLLLSIPVQDIVNYQSVAKDAFCFLNALCRVYPFPVLGCTKARLGNVLHLFKFALVRGTSLPEVAYTLQCLSGLTTFIMDEMLNSRSKHVELVQQHLQIAEDAYPHLLTLLIRHALSSSYVDKWVMARPVLNLVLLFPQQLALVRSDVLPSYARAGEEDIPIQNDFDYVLRKVLLPPSSGGSAEASMDDTVFDSDLNLNSSVDGDGGGSSASPEDLVADFLRRARRTHGRSLDVARVTFVDSFAGFYRRYRLPDSE